MKRGGATAPFFMINLHRIKLWSARV